jgi:flagellar assembly factor FliW
MEEYMLIRTKDFDYVEINNDDILEFPNGIYAYEDIKKFVLLKNPENQWMMYLQSIDFVNPRLVLLDPYVFFSDYAPILPEGSLELLKTHKISDLSFFVVAVIPGNIKSSTVNLKSPVIINFTKKIGAQIILENKDYGIRTNLFGTSEHKNREVIYACNNKESL